MAVESPPPGVVQQIAGLGPLIGAVGTAVAAVIKAYSDVKSRNTWVFGQQRVSAKAMAAMAFGLASIPSVSGFLVGSASAVLLGETARRDIRKANLRGKPAATLGTVTGGVGLGLAAYAVWYVFLAPNLSIIYTALASAAVVILVTFVSQELTLVLTRGQQWQALNPIVWISAPVWFYEKLRATFDSDKRDGTVTRIVVGVLSGIAIGVIFTTIYTALFSVKVTDLNPLLPIGPLPSPRPTTAPLFPTK